MWLLYYMYPLYSYHFNGVTTSWHADEFVLPLEDLLFHRRPTTSFGCLQNRKLTSCFWPIRILSKYYTLRSSSTYQLAPFLQKGLLSETPHIPVDHRTWYYSYFKRGFCYYCDCKLNFGRQSFFNVTYVAVIREFWIFFLGTHSTHYQ